MVLPTYNEIDNVEKMLRTLRETVPAASILVVDDGSPDGTGDAAEKLSEELGQVSVLHRSGKQGLGTAYRQGFRWGLDRDFDRLVEIDCDFSHDPAVLPSMLALSEHFEVVIGSRYVPGGTTPAWPKTRLWLSRGGNRYASVMLGLGVVDSTAGYRVYTDTALRKIHFEDVRSDGYGFQVEMTYRARCGGASIVETPISFTDRTRGTSKMSSAIVFEALGMVTAWGVARLVGRRPVSRS